MENVSPNHIRSYVFTKHQLPPNVSARQLAKEVGKTHKWVQRWWNRPSQKCLPRGNSLLPRKLADSDVAFLKKKLKETKKSSGGDRKRKRSLRKVMTDLSVERGVNVGYETVRKTAKELGLRYKRPTKRPRLDAGFAARRFKFAKEMVGFDWSTILNSDSSPFYLKSVFNSQNDGTWVDDEDPDYFPDVVVDKHTLKTEVYIGISSLGISGPVFIDSPETVPQGNYAGRVLPVLAGSVGARKCKTNDPSTTRMFKSQTKFLFQQDLASPPPIKSRPAVVQRKSQIFFPKKILHPHSRNGRLKTFSVN
jgi:transposase